jgi:NADPH-dependent 2,4-dienoyl-CoA reductase/sulfur reductase-like enzyme
VNHPPVGHDLDHRVVTRLGRARVLAAQVTGVVADVVVVGAGHNGLVAAGLLARAGLAVTVLERAGWSAGRAAPSTVRPRARAGRVHRRVPARADAGGPGLRGTQVPSTSSTCWPYRTSLAAPVPWCTMTV